MCASEAPLPLSSGSCSSISSQPVEFPADRDKPDWEEQTVDVVARAYNGAKSLTDDADCASCYSQIGDAFVEDALQHDEREDQNAHCGQDTGSIHCVTLGDQALSRGREGGA